MLSPSSTIRTESWTDYWAGGSHEMQNRHQISRIDYWLFHRTVSAFDGLGAPLAVESWGRKLGNPRAHRACSCQIRLCWMYGRGTFGTSVS